MSEVRGPLEVYRQRLADRTQQHEALGRKDDVYANGRLAVFIIGLIVVWLTVVEKAFPLATMGLPVFAFLALVLFHERTVRAKSIAKAAMLYYQQGVDRIEDRWAGRGRSGEDLIPKNHLYAEDLDIFGEASLFELLCTCRTRAGEATLANWLCMTASKDEVEVRQTAVAELKDQLDFRESLAILAGTARARMRPERLVDWATAAPVLPKGRTYWTAVVLVAATLGAFAGWALDFFSLTPFILLVAVELFFFRSIKHRVIEVVEALDEPMKDLNAFSKVVRHFESAQFEAPKLCDLQQRLTASEVKASTSISQLARCVTWLDAYRNQIFAPIAFVLLWTVHFAYALERWRRRCGSKVPDWLDAIGELEALCALSAYAYEHPNDPFPEITDTELVFDGQELGHPLLPDASCVRNSVRLGNEPQLLVVSGSNMSGKSTLLRVVGINAVLALMGAPIRGASLRISALSIGASLHVVDSIQRGTSHFYAEITRLREILELSHGERPTLFLVDEILHGTNSNDRKTGAEAVLKGFLDAGGIGLVTTHDLALTKTEEAFGAKAVNVHFADHLEGDRLEFDYKMQEGVVERSNALALMRAIGLKV